MQSAKSDQVTEARLAFFERSARERTATSADDTYGGLRVHAKAGLHGAVAGMLSSRLEKGASVLDIGAGSGALSLRMRDMGYAVTALDLVAANFRVPGIPLVVADLDEDFDQAVGGASFDALVAVEIVEHLENPRHFFRVCRRLLGPGGLLLVTTPNVENPVSKAIFARFGYYQWFSPADRHQHGHVSPMTTFLLREAAEDAGFALETLTSHGDPFEAVSWDWWKMRLLARFLSWIAVKPAQRGEILVASCRRRT